MREKIPAANHQSIDPFLLPAFFIGGSLRQPDDGSTKINEFFRILLNAEAGYLS